MTEANVIAAQLQGKPAPKATKRKPRQATSARSLDVLAFMRDFFRRNDQLPPVAHIQRHFGWSSLNGAQWHVDALIRLGYVERNECGKLRFARKETT